jgi:hypothetical protein
MYTFAGESAIDLDALRGRLARMNDVALAWFGRAAAYMCSPEANMGKPRREAFLIQLREAREELRLYTTMPSGNMVSSLKRSNDFTVR